jgi:RNA polymerase sigma-70 factor (ECF subfamily)
MHTEAHAVRPSPHRGGRQGRSHVELVGGSSQPEIEAEHAETWQLVVAAQAGDGEAFGKLYDMYVDVVYRFVYFRVNDRGLAEDFTSETFLRALRRIGTITYQGRDIGAWLVTIARNIIFDHSKSARNRLEVTTGEFFESSESAPSPETAVLESLTSDTLIAGIKALNPEQRECVVLRFVQGLSVSETAAAMGKNDGAIKALQHRAIRKLGDLVGDSLR